MNQPTSAIKNKANQHLSNNMIAAGMALSKINALGIVVEHLDPNPITPVIRIRPSQAIKELHGQWVQTCRRHNGNQVKLMRGRICNCSVEWEINQ